MVLNRRLIGKMNQNHRANVYRFGELSDVTDAADDDRKRYF
ncbi:hypothetical protein [Micromonospora sp. 15K316]|nr:hypothetical protein [Micromonospora sp. 15K316]